MRRCYQRLHILPNRLHLVILSQLNPFIGHMATIDVQRIHRIEEIPAREK